MLILFKSFDFPLKYKVLKQKIGSKFDTTLKTGRNILMNFISGKQLLEICSEKHIPISQAMFLRETDYLEQDPVDVTRKMERAYDIMKQAIHRALTEDLISTGGMIGGESKQMDALRKAGKNICGPLVSKAIAYAVGVLEVNASMGLIVAAPTARLFRGYSGRALCGAGRI